MIARRKFLLGLTSALAAPAIVPVRSLMAMPRAPYVPPLFGPPRPLLAVLMDRIGLITTVPAYARVEGLGVAIHFDAPKHMVVRGVEIIRPDDGAPLLSYNDGKDRCMNTTDTMTIIVTVDAPPSHPYFPIGHDELCGHLRRKFLREFA